MEKIAYNFRKFFFRVLGIDYERFLKKLDFVFLKDDSYTKIGTKSYENGAVVSRSGTSEIIIGKYCSIAQNVRFFADGGNHMFSAVTSFPLFDNLFEDNELNKIEFRQKFNEKEGIVVGHSVWIGSGAYIMPGVKIGNGVTIAANSVVTKDVPDYALVAGSPAKNIKMKHDLDTIAKLNKIAWWDWDEKVIKNRIEDFYHKDIQSFVNTYYHE
jgi:virginiamycin A acetyltransferase